MKTQFLEAIWTRRKVYEKLRSKYYWKNMFRDISKYINSCSICHATKPKRKCKIPMKLIKTPQSPFDVIIIDTIVGLDQVMEMHMQSLWFVT